MIARVFRRGDGQIDRQADDNGLHLIARRLIAIDAPVGFAEKTAFPFFHG